MIRQPKFLSAFIVWILMTGFTVSGQSVSICKKFSNTGVGKDVMSEITVDSLPIKLKVLYSNGKTTIDRSKINMLLEFDDSMKKEAEPFYLNVSQGRSWVGSDITFNHAGNHVISAFTPENKILASTNFKVILKGEAKAEPEKVETPIKEEQVTPAEEKRVEVKEIKKEQSLVPVATEPEEENNDEILATGFDTEKKVAISEIEAETLHYDGIKLEFGTSKSDKGLYGVESKFKLDMGRADVIGLLRNQLPVKTKMLQVDIWQKGKDGTFSELTVSEEHECNPKSYKSYFKLRFYREGDYKISIYTDDFVWICSGYLTVTR